MAVKESEIYSSLWTRCDPLRGFVLFNTEFVKKNKDLLEYVVVYELCHLLEPISCRHKYLQYKAMQRAWTIAKKEDARLAYLVATARHCFKCKNVFSMKWHTLYSYLSYCFCGLLSRRLSGITAWISSSSSWLRKALALYALSAITTLGLSPSTRG